MKQKKYNRHWQQLSGYYSQQVNPMLTKQDKNEDLHLFADTYSQQTKPPILVGESRLGARDKTADIHSETGLERFIHKYGEHWKEIADGRG